MSDENPNNKNPKKVQYNTYWIYGLIIFFVLAVNALAFNNSFAKIFIKKEKLGKYNIEENSFNAEQPHYTMEIGDVGKFEERLDKLISNGADFVFDFDTEANYLAGILSWIFPFLLLIGLWIFFFRRMSGGAGGPGAQIFNIGKSK